MSLAATSDPDLYDGHFFRLEKDGAVTDQQVITLFVTSRTNLDVTWPDGSTQPGSLLLDVDGSAQSSIDLGPGCLAYVGLDGTHADCLFYPEDDVAPAQSSDPIAIPTQDEAMSYLCSADVGELSDVTDSSSDPYSTSVLQAALTSLGYDSGPIDGRYGRTSKRAIREYQSDAGLTVDARVGPQTWASLQNAACQLPEDPARPVD